LESSLCLSRACLGKKITFIYKWLKKTVFFYALKGGVDCAKKGNGWSTTELRREARWGEYRLYAQMDVAGKISSRHAHVMLISCSRHAAHRDLIFFTLNSTRLTSYYVTYSFSLTQHMSTCRVSSVVCCLLSVVLRRNGNRGGQDACARPCLRICAVASPPVYRLRMAGLPGPRRPERNPHAQKRSVNKLFSSPGWLVACLCFLRAQFGCESNEIYIRLTMLTNWSDHVGNITFGRARAHRSKVRRPPRRSCGLRSAGKKTAVLSAHFISKNDQFAKTGSGQT
jgi:hypothetical protein